uniref:Uncharacterized protein n=1 Tax=Moniliophthora roreri TaxID=221103 RepID=A0A0W0GEE9_MONRR
MKTFPGPTLLNSNYDQRTNYPPTLTTPTRHSSRSLLDMTINDYKTKSAKAFFVFVILSQFPTISAAPAPVASSLDSILHHEIPDKTLPVSTSSVQAAGALHSSSIISILDIPTPSPGTLDVVSATSLVPESLPIGLSSSLASILSTTATASSISALVDEPTTTAVIPLDTPLETPSSTLPIQFGPSTTEVPTIIPSTTSASYTASSRPLLSTLAFSSSSITLVRTSTLPSATGTALSFMPSHDSVGTLTVHADEDTSIVLAQIASPTATPTTITDPGSVDKPYGLTTQHQVVIFSSILGVLFTFAVASFIVTKAQHANWCRRIRRTNYGLGRCIEKDMEEGSWTKLASQNSITQPSPTLSLSYHPFHDPMSSLRSSLMEQPQTSMQEKDIARLRNRVLDIVPDFPRSRFSVTSSDLGSVYSDSKFVIGEDEEEGDEEEEEDFAPLLSPEEFFSLPSTSTIASRHSRRNSAPVFGRKRRIAGLSVAEYRMSRAVAEHRLSRAQTTRRKSAAVRFTHRKSHSVVCAPTEDGKWI